MAFTNPLSPQKSGFMPLSNQQSSSAEADIPLTSVLSHGTSSGVRKSHQSTFNTADMEGSGKEEKRGLFRRGPAGRRRLQREPSRNASMRSDDTRLNAMGRIYNKVVSFSIITRYMVYVIPVAILLAVPIVILPITGHKDDIHVGGVLPDPNDATRTVNGPSLFLLFIWIEISWLSLWIGKIVAHFLPPIFMFFCGVISSGTRKYATVLKALEIYLSLFFWGLASWLTFKYIFNQTAFFDWVRILTNILGALFVCSAVLLGEKTIVQLISITYHQRSFANRIADSKHEVYLLGLLYDASRKLFPMYCPEFAEEDYIINDSIDMMLASKSKKHKKSGSVTPLQVIGEVGRFGDKITSVFGNIASEITGKQVFNPNSAHSIVVEALEKVRSSEALGRRIWMSFVVEGSESLHLDDIVEVLGPAHHAEAEECFQAIDADSNGDISLDEMVRKTVEIGKERKAITNSMKDISQALAVFDNVLLFLVLLICIFVFLAFFQSSFITTLATAGTALLSLSFVFAVTTQEFLGSCIFLFVKHPYDVGDRVDIQGSEKEQLVVERISLLYTVFVRIDKMQVVQVPNIVLNNLWVENVTRSKAMKEVVDVNVSYDTSFEDIELLRLEMEKFVRSPENSRDFQPDLAIGVAGVGDLDKIQLKVVIKHKSNWHNEAVRATRRSKFICALALALKKVHINPPGGGGEALGGPTNPSYSVAVSDDFAVKSREKSDKDKAEAKAKSLREQQPSKSLSTKSGSKKAESKAAAKLNSRRGTVDEVDDSIGRDDRTLSSREQSAERERVRNNDIESMRTELLHGRESQRGRRKPGEGLPPTPLGEGTPGVSVTRWNTQRAGARTFDRDVEKQAADQAQARNQAYAYQMQQQYAAQQQVGGAIPLNTVASAPPVPSVPSVPQQYSFFPPPQQAYSPPMSSSSTAGGPPHPLQSAPTAGSIASRERSRSRAASASRSQMGSSGNAGSGR